MAALSAPNPFLQLASIEVQLVMHHLDARSRLFFARCSRSLQRDAEAPFAWEHCIINVPAMRALHDPRFLDQLRSSRFRSLPTRLCWSAHPPSPSAQPSVSLQSPTLQPSPVSDSRGSVPPSADASSEAPVSSPPPPTDMLLIVASLLARPVAIEAAGPTIDWPTLLRQPNMQSITALSIQQFDVLQLKTLEVLRSLPRLHQLELRLMNPGQVHSASAHLPLLMQLPALDDLTCDFALWLRVAPLRPARQLRRLEVYYCPRSETNVIRMSLCVPQLAALEVLSMQDPLIRRPAVDYAFDRDCTASLLHLKAMREFFIRVRQSGQLIALLQLYASPLLERLQLDCVDHLPDPSLLRRLLTHRPSLRLGLRIFFVDKPRPRFIDPAPLRVLTQGPLARRVCIEGLGRTHDEDYSASCGNFGGPLEEGKEGEVDRRGAVHLHPCMS
jgi:hypothetical protein